MEDEETNCVDPLIRRDSFRGLDGDTDRQVGRCVGKTSCVAGNGSCDGVGVGVGVGVGDSVFGWVSEDQRRLPSRGAYGYNANTFLFEGVFNVDRAGVNAIIDGCVGCGGVGCGCGGIGCGASGDFESGLSSLRFRRIETKFGFEFEEKSDRSTKASAMAETRTAKSSSRAWMATSGTATSLTAKSWMAKISLSETWAQSSTTKSSTSKNRRRYKLRRSPTIKDVGRSLSSTRRPSSRKSDYKAYLSFLTSLFFALLCVGLTSSSSSLSSSSSSSSTFLKSHFLQDLRTKFLDSESSSVLNIESEDLRRHRRRRRRHPRTRSLDPRLSADLAFPHLQQSARFPTPRRRTDPYLPASRLTRSSHLPTLSGHRRRLPAQRPRRSSIAGVPSAPDLTSGLTSISVSGSQVAPRSTAPTFVNQAAVIGEDVSVECPLNNPIAWMKDDGTILYMENIKMYNDDEYGAAKFQLSSSQDLRHYQLTIRAVDFHDAGPYVCQNHGGQKAKAAVTVIEQPNCFDKRTTLRETELAAYKCMVRVKGADSRATSIAWNKPKATKTRRTNSSDPDFVIVSSDLEYRARYQDNGDPLLCFARNPRWNRTLPMPNCSLGTLDVLFPPKLVCDRLQVFPSDPLGNLYVFCDVLANPIEDLDSILWYVKASGRPRRIEEFVNLTRVDKSIVNGYRSRLDVPHSLLDEVGEDGAVDFLLKIYYGGQTTTRDIRLATETRGATTYAYVGAALGVGVVIVACVACCCFRCYKPDPDKEPRNGHVTANGHATRLQGNEIEVKPKHLEAHYRRGVESRTDFVDRNHRHHRLNHHGQQHQQQQQQQQQESITPRNNESAEEGTRRVRFQNNV